MLRIVTVFGIRPEGSKLAPVFRKLQRRSLGPSELAEGGHICRSQRGHRQSGDRRAALGSRAARDTYQVVAPDACSPLGGNQILTLW